MKKRSLIDGRGKAETEVVAACEEPITTVHEALRTVQTAALDVRDAVVALQRLHERIQTEGIPTEAGRALESALEQGVALVHSSDAVGMYDPVPIELL